MSKDSDQWKSDGKCSECRRQNYCKKQCTANRKHQELIIKKAIYDKTNLGILKAYLERS